MPWSNGAFCAISLVYVGGRDEHAELALPLLRQLGLPATFFLDPIRVIDQVRLWEPVRATEHEIGLQPFASAQSSGYLPGWNQRIFGEELRSAKKFGKEIFGTRVQSIYHSGSTLYGDESSFGPILEREFSNVVSSVQGVNTPISSPHHLQVRPWESYPCSEVTSHFESTTPEWLIIPFYGLFEGDYTRILNHRLVLERIGRHRSQLKVGTISEIAAELRRRQSPVN